MSCVGACCRIIGIGEGSIGDGCWSCDSVESWGDGERSGAAGGDCGCEDGGNSGNVDNCGGVANSSCVNVQKAAVEMRTAAVNPIMEKDL